MSPVVQFPNPELDSKKTSAASEIGFSTGSGHDLEGDVINVDGKNWTVRGESILDYWAHEVLDSDFNGSFDMVVTDIGVAYVCTTNTSEIHFHTLHQNGTLETLLVQELSGNRPMDVRLESLTKIEFKSYTTFGMAEVRRLEVTLD